MSPALAVTDDRVDQDASSVLAGRYQVIRELGVGGMGVVWLAHDRVLNVDVALKLIMQPTPDASARALTEARAAARLTHPAVCRVLDYGTSRRGEPFIVAELLVGETLEDLLLKRGRLTAIEAVRTLLPILDALDTAHAAGIVHRDVKPSNIFLASQGGGIQPKLLDFGIARSSEEETRHTITGQIVGTPDYMSPEQARGSREAGPASDLWSFCATLYEAVTGITPFTGENYNAIIWAIQNDDPRPFPSVASGDARIEEIIGRGLQRDERMRWSSAAELAGELSRWLVAQGIDTDLCERSLRPRAPPELGRRHRTPSPCAPGNSLPTLRAPSTPAKSIGLRRAVAPRTIAAGALTLLALLGSGYYSLRVSASEPAPEHSANMPAPERMLAPEKPETAQVATAGRRPALLQPAPAPSVSADQAAASTALVVRKPVVTEAPAKTRSPKAPPDLAAESQPAAPDPVQAPPAPSNALGYDFGL